MPGGDYSDELIIKARRMMEEAQKKSHSNEVVQEELQQSIYDDVVTIFEVPVVFQDRDIIENRATIRMPTDFIARTDEEISSVYALGSKPQYVYSNGYLSFMVAFNWTTNLISDDNIHDFTQFASRAIERTGPQCRILNTEKLYRPDCNLSILQFLAQTLDSVNMNVMFFASMEGRLMIGSITFDQKDADRLRPLAVEMAKSFHLNHEEGKDNEHDQSQ